jgi:hypothetical protein
MRLHKEKHNFVYSLSGVYLIVNERSVLSEHVVRIENIKCP